MAPYNALDLTRDMRAGQFAIVQKCGFERRGKQHVDRLGR